MIIHGSPMSSTCSVSILLVDIMHMIYYEINNFRCIYKKALLGLGETFSFHIECGSFLTDSSICNFCNLDHQLLLDTEMPTGD